MLQAGRPRVHGSIFEWTKRFSFFFEALRQALRATWPSVQSITPEFFMEMKRLKCEAGPGVVSGLRMRGAITPPWTLNLIKQKDIFHFTCFQASAAK